MFHLGKLAYRLPPYPLGGRQGRGQRRILGLQGFQAPQLLVIHIILHLRIVQHIIAIIRLVEFFG